ncbi:MAG: DUF4291 family protein [Candidatus Eremiobacterota bacterium]
MRRPGCTSERSLRGEKLPYRSIQVGVGRQLCADYARNWIRGIRDLTPLVRRLRGLLDQGDTGRAAALLPPEPCLPRCTRAGPAPRDGQ